MDEQGNETSRLWAFNYVDSQWNMSFLAGIFTAQPVLVMAEMEPLQGGFLGLQLFLYAWREGVGLRHSVIIDSTPDQWRKPKKRQHKDDGTGDSEKRSKRQK